MAIPSLTQKKRRLLEILKREGITDEAVLRAIAEVPREKFVPNYLRHQAYENAALPIESGQTISQPYVVAYMTQELRVGRKMKVLEVGTGSGYQGAVLSRLCRRLFTIERHLPLLNTAEALFRELGYFNITTLFGDGMKGWPEQAPFDRIMVTAAAEKVPQRLLDQLAEDGGIMIIPIGGQEETQHIYRITRQGEDFETEILLPVKFVPLLGGIVHDSS
ncbi:protein-L-isoaspartate(D-aspartate) O-methyltransferase [Luteithermobacter gelatinilyticus]|uniref:protein-L-isoaspartate(D-aspartate) O-methyltransferase n=1 Tax=Luteithermobacter gelatinilyticus TaxID=2582913 RepID=UPI00110624B1|nr:protein-L-isoaspartate(D-aspartate) O-methyltransferase [Luteithermobacter gelatinilyticus]